MNEIDKQIANYEKQLEELEKMKTKIKKDPIKLLDELMGLDFLFELIADKDTTVEEWLGVNLIKDKHMKAYPNAKKAYDIKSSPLGKALK